MNDTAPITSPRDFSEADGWSWHDAAIIAVGRETEQGEQFSIAAIEVYASARTGELAGATLDLGRFDDLDQAAVRYHQMQHTVYASGMPVFALPDVAAAWAADHAEATGTPAPEWQAADAAAMQAYDEVRALDARALEVLQQPPAAPDPQPDAPGFRALREIGIAADGFDPERDPPPFVDPASGTAYWIGIFQPDRDDPDLAVASILSLGRDPDTGEMAAQLAPIVPGDREKAQDAAEYLLGVVARGGIERAFEAAEGMALATDQRALWQTGRGIALDPDAARQLADDVGAGQELDR